MRLDQGDLVLVPFPYSDLTSKKQRPALVLSNAAFNEGRDVIVCAITSNLQNTPYSVLIDQKDLATGRLAATSRVKASKVATLERSLIRRRIGTLNPAATTQVLKELRALLPGL